MMGMGFGAQDFGMMDDTGSLVHASQYALSEGLPPGLSMDESGHLHGLNNLGPPVPEGEGTEGSRQGQAAAGGQAGSEVGKGPEQEGVSLPGPSSGVAPPQGS